MTHNCPTESQEQIAIIDWCNLKRLRFHSTPNEGRRSPQHCARLKRMGLSPGYPDLSVDEARGGYFGLRIEVKQNRQYSDFEKKSKTWICQEEWLNFLADEGYFALRVYGFDMAKHIIETYIAWPRTVFSPQVVDFQTLSYL